MENLADHFGNYAERAVKAYNEMDTETQRDVAVLAAILFFIPILIYIISTVVSALQTTSRLASLASVSLLLGTFGLVHHESNRVQAVLHTKPFDSELGLLNPSQVREWLMTLLSSPESVELHDVFSRVDLVLPLISIITATILLPVSARISSSLKSFSYSAAWIYACCDLAENISLLSLIHTPSLSSFALQHEDAVFTPLLAIRLTKFVAVAFFVLSYLLSLFF